MQPEPTPRVLSPAEWRVAESAHRHRVAAWVEPRLERRRRGERHPIEDFLFDYYRFRPGQVLTWHPGWRAAVSDHPGLAGHRDYDTEARVTRVRRELSAHRAAALDRAIKILDATASRPAAFGCFGLHEWAMVHGLPGDEVRHRQVPLRVSRARVATAIDEVGLRCTHFDAYRFFTPAAQPLQQPLSRATQPDHEQPGCIHAGMDLYRHAYEASPLVASELVADCLSFARDAREIDMRASPYDLADWNLAPIPVETTAGRREYAELQRSLAGRAAPLRTRLAAELREVRAWAGSPT